MYDACITVGTSVCGCSFWFAPCEGVQRRILRDLKGCEKTPSAPLAPPRATGPHHLRRPSHSLPTLSPVAAAGRGRPAKPGRRRRRRLFIPRVLEAGRGPPFPDGGALRAASVRRVRVALAAVSPAAALDLRWRRVQEVACGCSAHGGCSGRLGPRWARRAQMGSSGLGRCGCRGPWRWRRRRGRPWDSGLATCLSQRSGRSFTGPPGPGRASRAWCAPAALSGR